jgi:hypothetical protein
VRRFRVTGRTLVVTVGIAAGSIGFASSTAAGALASAQHRGFAYTCEEDLKTATDALKLANDYLSQKVIWINGISVKGIPSDGAYVSVKQATDYYTLEYWSGNLTNAEYRSGLLYLAGAAKATHVRIQTIATNFAAIRARLEAKCHAATPTPPTPTPTPTAGSLTLIPTLTQVQNANSSNLTSVDPTGKAHVDQGAVSWDETWTVPTTITPGKTSPVMLGLNVMNNGPKPGAGQYNVGISVTAAGGLAQQLLLDISANLSGQQTYEWTVPAASNGEVVLVIHPYESSSVTYHYRPSG